MLQRVLRVAALVVAGLPGALPAQAASPLEAVFSSVEQVREFRQVAISPDGRLVAWCEKARDAGGADVLGVVRVAERASGRTWTVSAGTPGRHRERDVAFSPDGRQLAFLSDAREPGQAQLYVVPSEGGTPRAVTQVVGQLAQPRFAPDGRSVALRFMAGSRHEAGALTAHARDAGVVEEEVAYERIAVADLASGRVREVSPPGLYVYDYDWSADGRRFVAEAARGSGTDSYWVAELHLIDAASGEARLLWKPALQLASPRFSPDGAWVACIHGLMSDEGSNGGDVWAVPAAGGEPRNLTLDLPASAKALGWRANGEVVFSAHQDGGFALFAARPEGGTPRRLWAGAETLSYFDVVPAGEALAVVRHSFRAPPEAWAGPAGAWRQVSHLNDGLQPMWGEAKSLRWTSDEWSVQGFLLYPRDFEPSGRYPLVVVVHGGPSAAHSAGWPTRWTATLPSQGYFVLLPNPRGSFGFGQRFTQANVKDFGHGDLRDILGGVDEALRVAPIDPRRVGVVGWSYGGYMAMWAPTQTDRFRAAVAGAGITNWQSYYGQNRIDQWMLPFFGASVYDDPEVYARSAPITFVKRHRTPTLVLHGERDSEVPAPQGYEHWHALKTLGVPTQLVIYPDEGHALHAREHRLDVLERTLGWFDRWLR